MKLLNFFIIKFQYIIHTFRHNGNVILLLNTNKMSEIDFRPIHFMELYVLIILIYQKAMNSDKNNTGLGILINLRIKRLSLIESF